jgi:enamine deaminase RidA (YjgF/YER057c/UK114 family)
MGNANPETRLRELGYPLPDAAPAVGLYLPALRLGDLVYTSGAIPLVGGEVAFRGHVGAETSLEEAQEAARICLLNALAAIRGEAGSLSNVSRFVKLSGFVSSAPGFEDQPQVMNAASQLLIDAFGEAGRCVRSAVGVAELPLGAAVELELIAELR